MGGFVGNEILMFSERKMNHNNNYAIRNQPVAVRQRYP